MEVEAVRHQRDPQLDPGPARRRDRGEVQGPGRRAHLGHVGRPRPRQRPYLLDDGRPAAAGVGFLVHHRRHGEEDRPGRPRRQGGRSGRHATALTCSASGTVSAKRSITATATRPGVVAAGRPGSYAAGGPNTATRRDGRTTSMSEAGWRHRLPRVTGLGSSTPAAAVHRSPAVGRAAPPRGGPALDGRATRYLPASRDRGGAKSRPPPGSARRPTNADAGSRANTGQGPWARPTSLMAEADRGRRSAFRRHRRRTTTRCSDRVGRPPGQRSTRSPEFGSGTSARSGVMPSRASRPSVARRRATVAVGSDTAPGVGRRGDGRVPHGGVAAFEVGDRGVGGVRRRADILPGRGKSDQGSGQRPDGQRVRADPSVRAPPLR